MDNTKTAPAPHTHDHHGHVHDANCGHDHAHGHHQHHATEPIRVSKVGRNDACPCGSGKKYKKCCLQHAHG